jgi:hypothetical protein
MTPAQAVQLRGVTQDKIRSRNQKEEFLFTFFKMRIGLRLVRGLFLFEWGVKFLLFCLKFEFSMTNS